MVWSVDSSSNLTYYDYVRQNQKNYTGLPDVRTADWPLVMSLPKLLILVAVYAIGVTKIGPRLMQHRKPFELKKTIAIYNLLQILLSFWMFVESAVVYKHYNWLCQPVDFTQSQLGVTAARITYVYYVAKLTEFLDTLFFVLRKKQNQVSGLHVYHHSLMAVYSWLAVRYFPGGNYLLVCLVNSFVHTIMYFYYFLAGVMENHRERLWWKKYITHIQLIQFFIGLLQCALLMIYDCGYPQWTTFINIPNAVLFIALFSDFYIKAYTAKDKRRTE